jgi:hypothetical protein
VSATGKALPPELVSLLIASVERAGRVAAGHPALSPPVIVGLLTDADRQVVEAAAADPSLPVAVMGVLTS